MIADKNYYGREFETALTAADVDLLRPTRKGEQQRPGERFFKPLRQHAATHTAGAVRQDDTVIAA